MKKETKSKIISAAAATNKWIIIFRTIIIFTKMEEIRICMVWDRLGKFIYIRLFFAVVKMRRRKKKSRKKMLFKTKKVKVWINHKKIVVQLIRI